MLKQNLCKQNSLYGISLKKYFFAIKINAGLWTKVSIYFRSLHLYYTFLLVKIGIALIVSLHLYYLFYLFSFSFQGVTSLSESCPNLQVLFLRRCINLTDAGIISVSEKCTSLVELNVGGCLLLTDASLQALGQNSKHLRSCNFSKATVLCFNCCH